MGKELKVGEISNPDKIKPPGYAALRRFRTSKPQAEYFLTVNLAERGAGLEKAAVTSAIIEHWEKLEADGSWLVRTAIVMPDHLHLLIQLGESISIDRCVKLLKGRLSPLLRANSRGWQSGYYEHELRSVEEVLPVFLYIYLNPYRAELLSTAEIWPGYRCRPDDWAWFAPLTKHSVPHPEWLR